jgi:guanylate kinase
LRGRADFEGDTTRGPRKGERDGIEYHFITPDVFATLVKEGKFIEHATFAGKSYGTSVQAVKDVTAKGQACVLDIEMEVLFFLLFLPRLFTLNMRLTRRRA